MKLRTIGGELQSSDLSNFTEMITNAKEMDCDWFDISMTYSAGTPRQ
jgi:hypothetical protein